MAATGAEYLLRLVCDACLSYRDAEIRHRPYHRNCDCPLHDLPSGTCRRIGQLSYPTRRLESTFCLSVAAPLSSAAPCCVSHSKDDVQVDDDRRWLYRWGI